MNLQVHVSDIIYIRDIIPVIMQVLSLIKRKFLNACDCFYSFSAYALRLGRGPPFLLLIQTVRRLYK